MVVPTARRNMIRRKRSTISDDVLTAAAEVIKCLGHPLRVRLLEALETGDKSVSDLQDYCGVSQATVSHQLIALKARGIVGCSREGSHMCYRITEPKVSAILKCIRSSD